MKHGHMLIYTNRSLICEVTYILRGPIYGLADGWVIMGIATTEETTAQLTAENEGLQKKINTLNGLCKSGEQRGFDKAKEHFQSQLSTAREAALREALNGCSANIVEASHTFDNYHNTGVASCLDSIRSLITTPASECELVNKSGYVKTACGADIGWQDSPLTDGSNWKFCPYCGKPLAQK